MATQVIDHPDLRSILRIQPLECEVQVDPEEEHMREADWEIYCNFGLGFQMLRYFAQLKVMHSNMKVVDSLKSQGMLHTCSVSFVVGGMGEKTRLSNEARVMNSHLI